MAYVPSIPPGPRTRSPLGHLFPFARNPLKFLVEISRAYSGNDVVHFRIRKRDVFLFLHPDLIEQVLVRDQKNFVKNPGFQTIKRILGEGLLSSQGDFHLRQRRMIQPAFHKQQLAKYGQVMVEVTDEYSRCWRDGAQVDIAAEMTRLTMAVVGKTLFNTDVEDEADEISLALTDALSLFHHINSPSAFLLDRLPFVKDRAFERGRARLDATIYRLISERRQNGSHQEDLLSLLLTTQDVETDGSGMSDEQVRDEALTLFLAGHETTAVALIWTWYLLARHPKVEAQIHAEIDDVLGNRLPSMDDVENLPFTRMVLSEAMRLYPPVYMIGRQALDDFRARNYVIPAGSSIVMSQYITQRDDRFYGYPDDFNPDRWSSDGQKAHQKYAYFPFGGGPRVCIGERFAWQEAILILATLARKWRMRLSPDHTLQLDPGVTLRPKGGLPVILEARS